MPSKRNDAKVTAVYSGVDWISASLDREELDNQTWLYDALHALGEVQKAGNVYKKRSLLGFDGWESGGCFVGSNETRHYAQFAGKYANDAFSWLTHPKVHVSRIDIQVTVQYDTELTKEGRYQYARAINHNKTLPKHRQRSINLYAGSDGGDTIYLGAPSSDTRARIYNKDKQSGDERYKWAWRYEIVLRNEYALPVYRQLTSEDIEVTSFITQAVVAYMGERGVSILGLGDWAGNAIQVPKSAPTDVERKLRWVRMQVIPTIRKLAELGYAEDLMELIAEAISAARSEQEQG